jgi:hypothetical protein
MPPIKKALVMIWIVNRISIRIKFGNPFIKYLDLSVISNRGHGTFEHFSCIHIFASPKNISIFRKVLFRKAMTKGRAKNATFKHL